jgi:hypothetical protein
MMRGRLGESIAVGLVAALGHVVMSFSKLREGLVAPVEFAADAFCVFLFVATFWFAWNILHKRTR